MADRILVDLPYMEFSRYFPNFESLLRFSIFMFEHTVTTDPNADLKRFHILFSRVLDTYQDPPLEAVWFFSAVAFHDDPDGLRSILDRICACTASSPAPAKRLALLAPVVSKLAQSVKPRKKVEALVEAVLRYIKICSSRPAVRQVNSDAGTLLPGFEDLVRVWNMRDLGDSSPFKVLFPLVGDEARLELMKEGCSVTFLAEVVVAEAILLSFCLKVKGASGGQRSELRTRLMTWAIGSIQVVKNQQFFGVLLNMLVNPPLPVMSVLIDDDDEILVRSLLYDALILSGYSVFSGAKVDQADSLSILVITFDAIKDARREKDEEKAMSYIKAFESSDIPRYLTSWASQAGTNQLDKPTDTTPQAFVEWLVNLGDEALFGEKFSMLKQRLMVDQGLDENIQ